MCQLGDCVGFRVAQLIEFNTIRWLHENAAAQLPSFKNLR